MELIRSNRTEALADALADEVGREPLGPLEKEVVVVQSRGMDRWLMLALTRRLGIWANPWFPFPRKLIEWVLEELGVGRSDASSSYEGARLKWTLAELIRRDPPVGLESYLAASGDDERALRLATSVASVFDGYVTYRPDLLARWANGDEEHWQAELWRRVVGRLGPHDLASRMQEGIRVLRADEALPPADLRRLHLFSLETLPPLFLRFFGELARVVPTWVYSLEPSKHFMSDVATRSERTLAGGEAIDGHPFLADCGRLSRDFQRLLVEADAHSAEEGEKFARPERDTLLHSVQSDILELTGPPEPSSRAVLRRGDPSISIHACTGPMREAQVLHDVVRGALEDDTDLHPEDIVIMTPDLETYAPVFRAVFGEQEGHRIPYEVHDRKTRDDAYFHEDFLAVLEVLDSRFSVLDIMRLMDARSMREDFRFTQDERSRLADLLSASGVRWGIDEEHRGELEFPREALHTWRAGLDRLFLGFASMPGSVEVFRGLLPRGAPSLDDAALIARLAGLCDVLFDFQRRSRQASVLDVWAEDLARLCSQLFCEDDDTSPALRILREALESLRKVAGRGGYEGKVSLRTVRRELASWLARETPAVGFLRRGVTLTELVPLRSVPFEMVCLVGMSEDAFPRPDDRPSFDRTRDEHRPGDRNKRDDDRHSFLQALLCARNRLVVTYSAPATSLRTGANPSPVVWELREAVSRYYTADDGGELLEPIVHPLHAFDANYFTEGGLPRSFSERYAEIARTVSKAPRERLSVELSAPATEPESSLPVRELTSWLWNPARSFLDGVLKARFDTAELYEPTGALTALTPLNASKVGNEALAAGLQSDALETFLAAAPEFPDGSWGTLERLRLCREVEAVASKERGLRAAEITRGELLEVDIDGTMLEARLDGLGAEHRVVARFTKPGRRAELAVWVEHLLMQSADESLPRTTHLILRGGETNARWVSFGPVANPGGELKALVSLRRASQRKPLPLIERASREFALAFPESRAQALKNARRELNSQRRWDPRLAYLFGPNDPLDDDAFVEVFESAALAVYGPLLKHRSEP